jgi:hypothetical protein
MAIPCCCTKRLFRSSFAEKARVFVGKLERKKPLERFRRRWEDNIKVDIREVGWDMD